MQRRPPLRLEHAHEAPASSRGVMDVVWPFVAAQRSGPGCACPVHAGARPGGPRWWRRAFSTAIHGACTQPASGDHAPPAFREGHNDLECLLKAAHCNADHPSSRAGPRWRPPPAGGRWLRCGPSWRQCTAEWSRPVLAWSTLAPALQECPDGGGVPLLKYRPWLAPCVLGRPTFAPARRRATTTSECPLKAAPAAQTTFVSSTPVLAPASRRGRGRVCLHRGNVLWSGSITAGLVHRWRPPPGAPQ